MSYKATIYQPRRSPRTLEGTELSNLGISFQPFVQCLVVSLEEARMQMGVNPFVGLQIIHQTTKDLILKGPDLYRNPVERNQEAEYVVAKLMRQENVSKIYGPVMIVQVVKPARAPRKKRVVPTPVERTTKLVAEEFMNQHGFLVEEMPEDLVESRTSYERLLYAFRSATYAMREILDLHR